MIIFSRAGMQEEILAVQKLREEARKVSEAAWPDWVNANKDKIRLSGTDGYVPEREEWIKRCTYFLACLKASG